jgi:signal transduction histidine kinase
MRTRNGQVLQWILFSDAVMMAVIGFLFWGSYPGPLQAMGIPMPEGYGDLASWRAVAMAGLFGGALIAFAAVLLALALSRDHERLLLSAPIVILGTSAFGFVAFAKVTAFGFPTLAHWLVVALVAPAGFLTIGCLLEVGRERLVSPETLRLKDAAAQAERSRLAQDLHDSVKQQIYSIQAHLAAADARWDSDRQGARTALVHARSGARDAMREMSALLDRLHDDPVEAVGLVEALRRQCDALGFQTGAQVTTEFGALPDTDRFDPAIMKALFRIGQEALANVARHARPTRVSVFAGVIRASGSEERFRFRIHDDGSGFDANAIDNATVAGMGLRSMGARAKEIGATLAITTAVGRGTSVEVTLPSPSRRAASIRTARHLLVGIGLPTLALLVWSASWPEWAPYLRLFVITGLLAIVSLGGWVGTAKWMKA